MDSKLLSLRISLVYRRFQYPPGCFITADILSILIVWDLAYLARPQSKHGLITLFVYILQYVVDGLDWNTEFYIAMAVHRLQQQLVVRNNPPVNNLLIHSSASYPHANVTYLSTIIRVTPPIQWVAIGSYLVGFQLCIAWDTFCYNDYPACKESWDWCNHRVHAPY